MVDGYGSASGPPGVSSSDEDGSIVAPAVG